MRYYLLHFHPQRVDMGRVQAALSYLLANGAVILGTFNADSIGQENWVVLGQGLLSKPLLQTLENAATEVGT